MNGIAMTDHLKSNYQDYYEDLDPQWRWLCAAGKAENIVSLCSALPHSSVLEIGVGEGSILKRLSDRGFGEKLHGLEISRSGVEAVRKKGIPRLVECLVFDGYNIPYDDRKFDLAILSHVVEHVEFPRRLIYEAARVAEYVFVEVPLGDTVRLKRDFVVNRAGHINFYSAKTIRILVQTCGLEVLRQTVTNPPKAAYRHRQGTKGLGIYWAKECFLKVLPCLASRILVYHSSLVCRTKSQCD